MKHFLVIVLIFTPGFCLAKKLDGIPLASHVDDLDEDETVHSTRQFTQKLYNVLPSTSNQIFSPFSIATLMAMLSAGARKATLKEIQSSMDFPPNLKDLYGSFRDLNQKIKIASSGNVTFVSSNRIFLQQGFQIQREFQGILEDNFGTLPEQLNFASSATATRHINELVAQDTRNKIQDLISPGILTNNTRIVALNALYFKGAWQNEFQSRATQDREFFQRGSHTVQIPTMTTEDFFKVAQIQEFDSKAIILPYRKSDFDMVLLLPNQRDGLADLENGLRSDPEALRRIFQALTEAQSKNIVLYLPKFTLESELDLEQPLSQLGIRQAFDEAEADFTRIAGLNEPLYLSKVLQKAYLEVSESGSEAGAATYGALFTPLSIGPPVEEIIKFDHPFLGFLRHTESNLILMAFRKVL